MFRFEANPESFSGTCAAIRRPKEIAYFSYDEDHQYRQDDSSMRYYYPPTLPVDLSGGFESFEQLDDSADDHLDSLLDTIRALEESTGKRSETDIITWRGMMTKIMATPFDNFNGFEMNATRFQDTIFIEENRAYKNEQKHIQNSRPSRPGAPSQELMSYWGYKFETLSLLPQPWGSTSRDYIEGRENQVVRNYSQYCSVARTGIGQCKLIIGGEIDAIWDARPQSPNDAINWVELKTTEDPNPSFPPSLIKYERKLLKFWIQSFLLGVPKIIVGFRSREGILRRIEELETSRIPGMVKRTKTGSWDGNVCINFTAAFLQWLKTVVTGDGVWRLRKQEKSRVIEVFKQEECGNGNILTSRFVDWRLKSTTSSQGEV